MKLNVAYDGGRPGAGGTATLYINGKSVGSVRVEKTELAIFSADETAGVGLDSETPLSEDHTRESSQFTGAIDKVTINLNRSVARSGFPGSGSKGLRCSKAVRRSCPRP
ncbi:MAG: hypothetical protein WCE62_06735 [Polyangiales bacterium]